MCGFEKPNYFRASKLFFFFFFKLAVGNFKTEHRHSINTGFYTEWKPVKVKSNLQRYFRHLVSTESKRDRSLYDLVDDDISTF